MESTNHNWLLLFRTSQCCRQAESDINTAGHIPLDTLEPCAAFEQRRHCPGYQPIQSQVKEAQDSIEATKQHKLPDNGTSGRINELWQEGKKEQSGFGIEQFYHHPLQKHARKRLWLSPATTMGPV